MSKQDIEINKIPTLNIIICGHIDHGKTTLLYKLSGKWTDTHSEELKRGITIRLGYADIILYKNAKGEYSRTQEGAPERYISFVDAPGHEMLMATMLSGAAIVDAAILVVAANEGIKPQTQEHLVALEAKQIKHVIIVQNKIDLVTKEQAAKNYKDIKNLVKGTIAENAPIIPVSAQQDINIDKIYEALCNLPLPERNLKDKPIFVVARSFDINKPGTIPQNLHGTVLGGTLKQGTLKIGDTIEIKPGLTVKENNQVTYKPLITKISALHKGKYSLEELTPGGSASIETELDMSLGKADTLSGTTVSTQGNLPENKSSVTLKHSLFKYILGSQQQIPVAPIKTNEMLLLSINTAVSAGMVKKIKGSDIELSLKIPIVATKGENVGLARNINNHWRLIGYGEII